MKLLSGLFRPKGISTGEYEKAAATIEAFAAGTGRMWDWDEFISIRKHDAYLEGVRLKCIAIPDQFPPPGPEAYCSAEGIAALRELASALRGRMSELGSQ